MIRRFIDSDGWMTAKEIGEVVRLDADTVRKKAREGEIPSHKNATGRRLFRLNDVLDALGLAKASS